MKQEDFLELADRYLREEMNSAERTEFETLCEQDRWKSVYREHVSFLHLLKNNAARVAFKTKLSETVRSKPKETILIRTWRMLKINAAAAAVVAVLSSLATLYLTGYFSTIKRTTSDYSALKREVNNVKRNVNAHQNAISNFHKGQDVVADPLQYGATGFMLTPDGYVVTNFHVVSGADSIHLQNSIGDSFKASVIHVDPEKDLAILHISDSTFVAPTRIPYTFHKREKDLGEAIYTIGYPRDEVVYGEGYLSSATGYSGDTTAYQISVPVNPGNSGGPLLDQHGHIIGIISGKQKGIDGAAFAIKTSALIESLNRIPADSLKGNIVLNNKNSLSNLPRTEQIKKIQDYIYMVKVY